MKSNVVVSVFFSFAICVLTLLPRASAQDAGYPFKLQPLEIIARLSELKSEGEVAKYQTCPAELEMAKWIKEKDISDGQWADAFLIASGECDAKDRQRHLKQLDSINDKLRKSTVKLKGREFGDKLLQELHEGAMSKGYEKEQSSLAVLLDQSNFNCVSSTVMYVLQAERLGQKVEIIEFPGGPGVEWARHVDVFGSRSKGRRRNHFKGWL